MLTREGHEVSCGAVGRTNQTLLNIIAMKACFSVRNLCLFGLVVATAALVAGCSSCSPGKSPGDPLSYNIAVSPGGSLSDKSARVDIVGLNPSDLPKWQSYSLKKYFNPGDLLRQDAVKVTAEFLPGQQKVFQLSKTDPIWDRWLKAGVQNLVVLADLPGAFEEGKIGSQDPRRQLVPLCKCYWPDKTTALNVEVLASGVKLVTLPREGWSLPPW